MGSLFDALEFNNEGARLVREGDTVAAVHAIRTALTLLKELPLDTVDTESEATLSTGARGPSSRLLASSLSSLSDADSMEARETETELSHNAVLYMFPHPVVIPDLIAMRSTNAISADQNLLSIKRTVSIIAVFNLALACHHFGIASGKSSPMERAMELYHIVWSTSSPDPAGEAVSSPARRIVALVQCLALNNMAHVYHGHFCEYEYSESCLKLMRTFVARTGCLDREEQSHSLLSSNEAAEIQLNIWYAHIPSSAAAA